MEKYTDTEITHCTQCPKHCPIGSVQCRRGQKFAESLQRKDYGETEENKTPDNCEDKFLKDPTQESEAREQYGQESYDSGPHGQESHDRGPHGRGRQRTENFRSGGDSSFHGRPEGFRGPHGEGFRGPHGEDFRGSHGDGFRGSHGEGFREAREEFRRGWHRQGMELEPEDELSALLRTCVYYLFQRGGRKNGQERILHILSHREELSQRELQEILRIQPGSISEILSKMERAGLLTRERDDNDKRRIVLKLTDAGRKKAADGGEQNRDFFAPLDGDQKEQLKGLLKILLDARGENEN